MLFIRKSKPLYLQMLGLAEIDALRRRFYLPA